MEATIPLYCFEDLGYKLKGIFIDLISQTLHISKFIQLFYD
jgi:hypothetical protein